MAPASKGALLNIHYYYMVLDIYAQCSTSISGSVLRQYSYETSIINIFIIQFSCHILFFNYTNKLVTYYLNDFFLKYAYFLLCFLYSYEILTTYGGTYFLIQKKFVMRVFLLKFSK